MESALFGGAHEPASDSLVTPVGCNGHLFNV
ncbi:hypothetical protein SAMN05444580_104130 [Rhodococcus tukisamuensis]|uniref:Uncharacterized protein n=1 Tax=Rhodococcus tukisamuensis TaxID=168276 RepID=A0A1G6UCY2_9NOCA|nr:hypothetical protein SAMN05444580_104130 [Rhodococcus tukisamuensis]